ncbi:Zn-dependent hydrolase [Zafaria cholistanensis]|uniref:Zn-dependent hydrolase n=1 Tax=Zafaria cholistanensis TaxID=1682741 RepID=A0A5A7NP51_9MICC|nr:allantoate amidohydrolase [Zafaria cholistanensis]GER22625.1 Zn-dependent hydrolase [Zafaria cholistanensis]
MGTVTQLLAAIADTGRDRRRGGYSRAAYTSADRELREWFTAEAAARGLAVETDANGILWAWWDLYDGGTRRPESSRRGALVTGSHLDSVPGGGAFDGPLGVASALAAVDRLRAREVSGALVRNRALAVAVFPEEEGSRFGVACLGSRLLAGAIDPARALNLRDADGNTFADVSRAHGLDPDRMGLDETALGRVGDFVELHVEQGRALGSPEFAGHGEHPGPAVAVGSSVLGHGRWRLTVTGQGNHAGTTLMEDRADPMVAAAQIVLAVRKLAAAVPGARATVGRLEPVPGGTNVIASRVDLWLDVRHPEDATVADLVERLHGQAQKIAAFEGCAARLLEESSSGTVHFDAALARSLEHSVRRTVPGAPALATGAGHDAGVLASVVPTGMLFVRNPTGISHSPEEHVEDGDAEAGVDALADALEDLL